MKKLDLNNYGVQEMNAEEMRKTDGGILRDVYDLFSWIAGWYIPHAKTHSDMSATLMNCM